MEGRREEWKEWRESEGRLMGGRGGKEEEGGDEGEGGDNSLHTSCILCAYHVPCGRGCLEAWEAGGEAAGKEVGDFADNSSINTPENTRFIK